jgi:hypothetical protein
LHIANRIPCPQSKNNLPALKNPRLPCSTLLLTFLSLLLTQTSFSQSRSNIGFRAGINKPYADAYKFGGGAALQINIALSEKWGIEPSIAYDKINGDRETYFYPKESIELYPELYPEPSVTFIEAESLNLLHFDLTAKYYISPNLFARLGPILYLAGGNEDLSAGGVGGTAAVGYQLKLDVRNKIEFVFNTDLINSGNGRGNGVIPIAGIKVAYAFNFSKQP